MPLKNTTPQRETDGLQGLLRLAQERNMLRDVIATIPQQLFFKNRRSVYVAVNELYASTLGRQPDEVIGKDDSAFFDREVAERQRAADEALMESGRSETLEEKLIIDGEERWIRLLKLPVRDHNEEVTGLLGFFLDITEQKRADLALIASEKRYRRLFESTRDCILIVDADSGAILDVNSSMTELTATTPEHFIGKRLWDIDALSNVVSSEEAFGQLRDEGYHRRPDIPMTLSDGRRLDIEFISNVYPVDEVNLMQCNIRDITEHNLRGTEHDRLLKAIEQVADSVFITDINGRIVYANSAFETVTGYSASDILGHKPSVLKSGVQDEALYSSLWATISNGETWRGRLINKKKNGNLYTADTSIAPVRDSRGVITSYVAVERDITSVLRLEAQFLQSQKMESIGRLVGGIAHDFNNLLTGILTYTDFAMEALPQGPIQDDLVEVKKAGLTAARLTNQLLAFGRKQVLQPQLLDLNQVLVDVEKLLRRLIGEDIDSVWIKAPDLALTKADPTQIQQVLMNLVVNARDAMPGGGKLRIETSNVAFDDDASDPSMEAGSYVMLAVSDTGSGMDEETLAQVFDPFFTTKEVGQGTGLGLSTVFGIVKQSGGNVFVSSEPGKGSCFKVYLPCDMTGAAGAGGEHWVGPESFRGNETILVVEDEKSLRTLTRRILEAAGYTVLTAANGAEALEVTQEYGGPIHLLLTDVIMPKMGGVALAKKLSSPPNSIRVLLMSGYTGDAQRPIFEDGTFFLPKPFTAAGLRGKVREVLDTVLE